MNKELCIIGGGATCVAFMVSLSRILLSCNRDCVPLSKITIFFDDDLAKGKAYGSKFFWHKLNTPSHLMSIVSEHSNDFITWLKKVKHDDVNYVPRFLYGRYLLQHLTVAIQRVEKHGIRVERIQERAIDIKVSGNFVSVRSAQSPWHKAHFLIYAPGSVNAPTFPQLERHPSFFPYSAIMNVGIKELCTDRIAVLGTSLTAIDAVLHCLNTGFNGQIDCYSRHAFLPTVHACSPQDRIVAKHMAYDSITSYYRKNGALGVDTCKKLLLLDLKRFADNEYQLTKKSTFGSVEYFAELVERASLAYLPLQALLQYTGTYTHKVWQMMEQREQIRFLQHYYPIWNTWRHPVPYATAKIILSALHNGRLRFFSYGGYTTDARAILLRHGESTIRYTMVIDATSGSNSVYKTQDTFLTKALKLAVVKPHMCGGLAVCTRTFAAHTHPALHTRIYALGQIAKGALLSTNFLWFNRDCARKVAMTILQPAC